MRDALAKLPIPSQLLAALLLLLGALMAPHPGQPHGCGPGLFLCGDDVATGRHRPTQHPAWPLAAVGSDAARDSVGGLLDRRPRWPVGGTALLVVMLGLKLLELRARRDIHVTLFLGYFLVLTQFLYNQSLWLAAYLFTGVIALIAIQVGLNRAQVVMRGQLRNTAIMITAALPIAIIVFVLFPRLQTPLWGINADTSNDRYQQSDDARRHQPAEPIERQPPSGFGFLVTHHRPSNVTGAGRFCGKRMVLVGTADGASRDRLRPSPRRGQNSTTRLPWNRPVSIGCSVWTSLPRRPTARA